MSVLVYAENAEGKFKKSAYELVSYGYAIAKKMNTTLSVVSIGKVIPQELENLGKYGAAKVLNAAGDKLDKFINQAYASVIAAAAKAEGATVVVLSNSFSGKGLAPRVSIKLGAALVSAVVALPEISTGFVVKKTAFSGKAFAEVELLSENKVLTLNPNAYKIVESVETGSINDFNPELPASDFGTSVQEIVKASNKISLPEAELVVSGGRGLKGPENWGMVEELAGLLGAATACSKPVSDADWRPHSEHVGQTGIAISPNLYIAIGISGAIQHLAGVSSSKVIVVINKDPEAPFFKVADYGIVGDAFEVVPKLIQALKTFKQHNA
jgi:electron transfer flavoprotein alpha subunit